MTAALVRILVVDDDPANRKLMADLVIREGYEVLIASGGEAALAILDQEQVDLVLLDVMMPKVDGMAVLAAWQKKGLLPALPVLVMTAHDERKLRISALTAGASDFITKPVDRLELVYRIRTLVELKQLRERAVSTAEDKVKELNHLLHLRFFQSPVAEIAWDDQFMISAWNPAAEKLFGYSQEEVLGGPANFLFPQAGKNKQHGDTFRVGPPTNSSTENIAKHGRVVHCEWHSAQLTSTDGEFQGVASVILDLTERTQLQLALGQSQKMEAMGQLAGGIAHDFNNILSVIMSYGAFLAHSLPEEDPRHDDATEIINATSRAAALTKQLLAFSRQQPAQKRPINLNDSLTQLQSLLMRTLGKQVKLSVSPASNPLVVLIDPVQFDQIALNLAVNARDAMPNGGQLQLELSETLPEHGHDPGWAVLSVTDTGVGMDEVTQRRAFEPFFTTKEVGRGTGLGLATCFGIVQDAGGRLQLRSALGQGTTVTVSLPLCREHARPLGREVAIDAVAPGNGEMILVAEDDEDLRKIAYRALSSAGYSVYLAQDGYEAIRLLDELGPRLALVVTDVVMPGPNGFEVAARARVSAPQAAVLLTSGFLEDAAQRVQKEGFPMLWKPTTPADLVREAGHILQRGRVAPLIHTKRHAVVAVADAGLEKGLLSMLTAASYVPRLMGSWAEAQQLLRSESEPILLICDLTCPGISVEGLLSFSKQGWRRTGTQAFLLNDGRLEAQELLAITREKFRVLDKPVQLNHFRDLLGRLDGQVDETRSTFPPSTLRRPSAPPQSMVASGVRLKKEHILIVEDDEVLAAASRAVLAEEFQVSIAQDLASAQAILSEAEVDALILDVSLPDGSGIELLGKLRGRNADVPVILTTGTLSSEVAAQAFRNRISEFLPKPFNASEVLVSVRAALDGSRAARLRAKLLTARFGGDDFVTDIPATERAFERALSKVRMVFQPIVRATNHTIFGYEALLRCDEPLLATPPRLLAAAEVLGRVDDVGRAVRSSIASTMYAATERREAIFVNIHPSEVSSGVLSLAEEPLLGLADQVVLEITERTSLEAGHKLESELTRLRAAGFRIAVDDLGEGYAGLSSLVHLQPDIAKIDMSLVRNIHQAPLKRDIVAALVDMARRSGIVVVAEGVETSDEGNVLVELGCDLLQGYLFARPGPAFPLVNIGARSSAAGTR